MSNQALDDIGVYENEVAVSFPLWLPGEKKAQTRMGEILAASRNSTQADFRWRVSGQLRQQLWQLKVVYVLVPSGFEVREVRVKSTGSGVWIVLDGLVTGDKVAVAGTAALKGMSMGPGSRSPNV